MTLAEMPITAYARFIRRLAESPRIDARELARRGKAVSDRQRGARRSVRATCDEHGPARTAWPCSVGRASPAQAACATRSGAHASAKERRRTRAKGLFANLSPSCRKPINLRQAPAHQSHST